MKWKPKKLGDVFLFIRNGASIKQEDGKSGVPITRIETIATGTVDETKLGYADVNGEQFSDYYLQENDILMSHINSWIHLGKCALVPKQDRAIIHGMNLLLLRPNNELINANFIKHYFGTINFKSQLHKISNQSVNQSSFAVTKLKELPISLPPLPTQQKIAAILDEADALRRKDKALLAKYDELLQAVFYDMFGDPVKNEKGWEKCPLSKMMKIERDNISAENIDDSYSYLGLEHIEKETGRILYSVPTSEIDLKSNKFKFTPEHILYGKLRPYLNKVALPDFAGICSTDILPIIPNATKGNKWFITQILRSKHFVDYSNSNSIGANLPRANARIVENYETISPSIALQNHFADCALLIDSQKSQIIQQQIHSENLFQSLMQRAFKGELVG